MARVCPFRSLLLEIDDGLTKADLEKLIFLSKDEIGSERESEDISSGLDLFEVFIKRDVINKECIDYLADLLVKIRRFDLRKVLYKKWVSVRQTCDERTTDTGSNHPLQIRPKVKDVCLQEHSKENPVMPVFPGHRLKHTVPEVLIDGQDVKDMDLEQPQGEGNQQRKQSAMPLEMSNLSPEDVSPLDDMIRRRKDEKRPPLPQQGCVESGSSESLYQNSGMPNGRHFLRDKQDRYLIVGNRSSTSSVDSLEARTGRHPSSKSSSDSGSCTSSVDSLDEQKATNRIVSRKPCRSMRSNSFQSKRWSTNSTISTISTISTDSLEDQYPDYLEHERGV
ncbi:uncharacterized protein LOC121426854 [Lytechinus variegatus]|uniref:uncharacterized protein LOC121426854 n=1 Tax=Lytechinus variegatus TaxID=7654 RepID=UPI001BB20D60|nr:uncharacterized protein LOC121426854 [Lytechinus variegatus]